MTVLVTGASGTTGSRVAERLQHKGFEIRAVHRPAFDWAAAETYAAALDGVDTVYLVAPTRGADAAAVMPPFLELARDRGVRRVVLLSGAAIPVGGPGAGTAHALIPGMFDEWAVLRPSYFMDNVTGEHHVAREIRERGTITTSTGDGQLAFNAADDIADVAVEALTGPVRNEALDITGPESLRWDDVAALLGVQHVHVSMEDQRQHLLGLGVPDPVAGLLALADTHLVAGHVEEPTDVVERVTGHPPRSFADFAARLT